MADDDEPETPETPAEESVAPTPEEPTAEAPAAEEPTAEAPAAEEPTAEAPAAEEPTAEAPATQEPAAEPEPVAEVPAAEEPTPEPESVAESAPAEEVVIAEVEAVEVDIEVEAVEVEAEDEADEEDEEEPAPRVKPAVPGAHLEVDIVPEGVDPLGRDEPEDPYAISYEEEPLDEAVEEEDEEVLTEPIATAAIDLAAGARYCATGKRKTAIARVILRPGKGEYRVNGRTLEEHFTRDTLQRNIRQPLETVGYQDRMDVVARLHGGGISAQAGALRHGVSRALLEADPNLRGELKKRGFLTRDSRAKERKKAGLKKARKRPQFSKR
jgi:small subunit ribosomal protein S9